jgi:ribosomal-protein-alanine N-acetyltransferase
MAAQSTPAHPAIMKAEVDTNTTADSPIPTPFVTTQRLIVRNMHPSDASSMCLNADNPRIAKHMSLVFPDPYTLAEANKWINMNINIPQVDNWVICERDAPDVVIGGIGLKLGRDVSSHTAEVGFWIGEKFWGRRYMPEVLEAFTEWCFLERKVEGKRLTKLGAYVFSPNTGSMRCLE